VQAPDAAGEAVVGRSHSHGFVSHPTMGRVEDAIREFLELP
jgi:hypothetical protein